MSIRILVVSETQLICNVIKHVVEHEKDMEVVGCATHMNDALAYVEQDHCSMVLIHSQLSRNGALSFVQLLCNSYPWLKSIVFDLPKSKQVILPYLEGGASGYILREDSVPEMVQKIRAAHNQQPIICPEIMAALMSRVAELADYRHAPTISVQTLAELTRREREVLELLGQELSNREIAQELVIEVGTVKNHVHSILKKLDVCSRHDAMAYLPILQSLKENVSAISASRIGLQSLPTAV
jgi:DNA-binding NarL/FixJ family response regulator